MELNNHLCFQLKECKKSIVKEFAEKLKKQIANIMYWSVGYVGYDEAMDVIDELLKEYENDISKS